MPIPWIARQWNKAGLNRATKHIAPWTPGFGVVIHGGRRSSRRYQTPVNVLATEDGYLFALTYGPDTDWIKVAELRHIVTHRQTGALAMYCRKRAVLRIKRGACGAAVTTASISPLVPATIRFIGQAHWCLEI